MQLQPTDLAYAAGIIDGEASLGVARRHQAGNRYPTHSAHVTVEMVDEELVQWLYGVFGGIRLRQRSRGENRRPTFIWRICNRQATTVLRQLLPYLRVKRRQAELLLQLQELMVRDGKLDDERVARRDAIKQQISELNRRGVAAQC